MEKHDFVTIANLTREKILYMIEMAQEFERHPNREMQLISKSHSNCGKRNFKI